MDLPPPDRQGRAIVDLDLQVVAVVKEGGKGDMGHIEPPPLITARGEDIAGLGEPEGHRGVGPDGGAHDLSGLPVDTRGDVQAENPGTADIHQFDCLPVQTPDLPVQAGAENGIHDPVGMDDLPPEGRRRFRSRHFHGKPGKDRQIYRSRSPASAGVPQEVHPRMPTQGKNLPGDDKSVAAVVPDPAEDHVALPPDTPLLRQDMDRRLSGVLHENLLGYPQFLRGPTIHGPHFLHPAYLHAAFLS